jgi:protein phosphatase
VAALLAELGHIRESEIAGHPRRKMLLRSIGQKEDVSLDLFKWWLQPGDRMLLCSDGVWNAFPDGEELAHYLGAASTPAEICREIVDEARERDGSDDASAVVVTVSRAAEQDANMLWQKIVPAGVASPLAL